MIELIEPYLTDTNLGILTLAISGIIFIALLIMWLNQVIIKGNSFNTEGELVEGPQGKLFPWWESPPFTVSERKTYSNPIMSLFISLGISFLIVMILGMIFSVLLLDNMVSVLSIFGIFAIIGSILYAVHRNKKYRKQLLTKDKLQGNAQV